jgi:hypothetical protein
MRLHCQSDFNSIRGFIIPIAIRILIKNRSGKNGDRFSDRNRSAIFRSKWGMVCPARAITPGPALPDPFGKAHLL